MLVDCHAHLASTAFDADRDAVRRRARAAGVGAILVVGEDPDENERILELVATQAGEGARMLACAGFHPDRFADDRPLPDRAERLRFADFVRRHRERLAAIGEVGLDRWWVKDAARRQAQAGFLEELAALAAEVDLPLNVHSRSAGHYTLDLLLSAGARRVLLHAFDGKASHAVRAAEAGYVLSVPPSVVRSEQKRKMVRALPLEALALESDAPVLGPDREVRNEPANVALARDVVAELKGVDPARVAEVTTLNAQRLFPALAAGRAS